MRDVAFFISFIFFGQKHLLHSSFLCIHFRIFKEEVFSITRSERLAKIDSDFENLVQLDLIVSEVTSDFQFTLNDLSSVSQDLTCCNQILAQFINIATSQYIIHHP